MLLLVQLPCACCIPRAGATDVVLASADWSLLGEVTAGAGADPFGAIATDGRSATLARRVGMAANAAAAGKSSAIDRVIDATMTQRCTAREYESSVCRRSFAEEVAQTMGHCGGEMGRGSAVSQLRSSLPHLCPPSSHPSVCSDRMVSSVLPSLTPPKKRSLFGRTKDANPPVKKSLRRGKQKGIGGVVQNEDHAIGSTRTQRQQCQRENKTGYTAMLIGASQLYSYESNRTKNKTSPRAQTARETENKKNNFVCLRCALRMRLLSHR